MAIHSDGQKLVNGRFYADVEATRAVAQRAAKQRRIRASTPGSVIAVGPRPISSRGGSLNGYSAF